MINMNETHAELAALMQDSLKKASTFTRTIIPKRMTADEVVGLINGEGSALIATVRKNGSPHNAWNPIVYVKNRLFTYADPHSVCYRNIERDGRVAAAITAKGRAVFIEGIAKNVGKVSELVDSLLPEIFSKVKDWIPSSWYNYSSFVVCQASIFEIQMNRILTYKGETSSET